jgi:hypothetical protein
MAAKMTVNRWFPPKQGALADHEVNDAHRRAYEMIYSLQDTVKQLQSQLGEHAGKIQSAHSKADSAHEAAKQAAGTINGLNVKAVPPKSGQTLKWNAATGQIEWT